MIDPIDFSMNEHWLPLFTGQVASNDSLLKELGAWLRDHPNEFVRLYHATSKVNAVMREGLLPTSATRRNSLQSRSGYVSLSVHPCLAKTFGEFAYPGHDIEIYAVTTCVRRLVPDVDQLANKRLYCPEYQNLTNTLGNSLVFGSGAQIKGRVEPFCLQPLSVLRKPAEIEFEELDECCAMR